jgi:hypothetical protein
MVEIMSIVPIELGLAEPALYDSVHRQAFTGWRDMAAERFTGEGHY